MTDKKAKKIGVKAATKMVAFSHVSKGAIVSGLRIRRCKTGIHLKYVLPGGLKVSTFCPIDSVKIRLEQLPLLPI